MRLAGMASLDDLPEDVVCRILVLECDAQACARYRQTHKSADTLVARLATENGAYRRKIVS